jgi:cytochrome oxidase Cu insertion factor (SCO1/SenC/PrrC family)
LLVGLFAIVLLLFSACSDSDNISKVSAQDYVGTKVNGQAPDFILQDQSGRQVSLSSFAGKVVVLAFLDPRCTDVCPLTAFHFRTASEALGDKTNGVAWLAVNVNPEATLDEIREATEKWDMVTVPNWHFLTGARDDLQKVWNDYDVAGGLEKPGKPGEAQHTPGVFIIDPIGEKRWYVSTAFEGAPPLGELLLKHIHDLFP